MMSTRLKTRKMEPESSPKEWLPEPYMKEAVKFLVKNGNAGLFFRPGMRKTSITLAAIQILLKKKMASKVLVVAPRRVCRLVWPAEAKKWADFQDLRVSVVHGKHKQEALDAEADIYVTTFETLEWLVGAEVMRSEKTGKKRVKVSIRDWKLFGFDMLVIDELSKYKHIDNVRAKLMKEILHTFKRRVGLTGSPAANGLINLFGQMYMLDMGKALGVFVSHFRSNYFEGAGFAPATQSGFRFNTQWRLKEGAEEQIYKAVSKTVLHMDDTSLIKMPQLMENNIDITLDDDARAKYDQLEELFFLAIDDKIVDAANVGVQMGKLRQLSGGAVFYNTFTEGGLKRPGGEWLNIHSAKLEAIDDLVEELNGDPILIGYEYSHELERLQKLLGKDVPVMGGGTSDKKAAAIEKSWNAGNIPVLLGQPQSMGHGLNFQESSGHVAWFTLTWDYELYDQFIRRVLRSGNTRTRVMVHRLIALNTVDEVVAGTLLRKETSQRNLFNALAAYRRARPTLAPSRLRAVTAVGKGSMAWAAPGKRAQRPTSARRT